MRIIVAFFLSVSLASFANAAEKKNVLFIAVDDLRPAVACLGDPAAKTPNLDAHMKRGTGFTRAYCQQAVCSPSRSSLLTGRRPDSTKVFDLVTHFRKALPDVVTLPQHFKNHGYHTQGIGKIFHGGYNDEPSWTVPHEPGRGRNFGPEGQKRLAQAKDDAMKNGQDVSRVRGLPFEAPEVDDDYLNDGWLANRGIELLRERKSQGKPFFLAVGFLKPHLPFVAPKKYWDLYDPAKLPKAPHPNAPKDAPRYALTNSGELRAYLGIPKDPEPIPADTERKLVHGYYAAVSYMDAQLGRLLAELDASGLRESTVVVLWGDHGWHLNDHGQWCKHTNFDVATRAALLVSAPGQTVTGRTSNAFVEFVDLYPTLAELCGLPAPAGVEGHSFAPLLNNPDQPWKPAAFSQYPRPNPATGPLMGYTVRTDQFRYVEWRDRKTGTVVSKELYDHRTDPGENVNVAAKRGNDAVCDGLAQQLLRGWQGNVPVAAPSADGSILLHSRMATVRGKMLRYEPQAHKDTLGYWTNKDDTAAWSFRTEKPGTYKVTVLQGCGKGSGGADVEIAAGESKVKFTVKDTGGFQAFELRDIGTLTVSKPGLHTLTVTPKSKPGAAVMDLRQIILVPEIKKD